jgi:hypothetical protein
VRALVLPAPWPSSATRSSSTYAPSEPAMLTAGDTCIAHANTLPRCLAHVIFLLLPASCRLLSKVPGTPEQCQNGGI